DCPIMGETNVNVIAIPTAPNLSSAFCDDYGDNYTDGIMSVNLNEFSVDPNLTYYYYESIEDLEEDRFIVNTENYINSVPFEQQLWYKVTNENGCSDQGELTLTISSLPELVLEDLYDFCSNNEASIINAPIGFDTYNWYLDDDSVNTLISTGEFFEPTQPGNYILEGIKYIGDIENDVFCSASTSFEVVYYDMAIITDVVVDNENNNISIEIVIEDSGEYEYSVDGVNFQEGNVFENLSPGNIIVYVNEKNGCGEVSEEIEVEALTSTGRFPNFFTPNGDGINDYWNYIPPDLNNNISIIHIFNRYGKLLYQISPFDEGWDGTFDGQLQHEDDYWYQALDYDHKSITGHFSLKY
ncbi:MAG: T9SS type B sorting domain-containing protein, partial [Maribacter sp.]